jgi:hypothetical protein
MDKILVILFINNFIVLFMFIEYLNIAFDRIQPITPYIIFLTFGYWSFYYLADAISRIDNDSAILLHQQYNLLIEQPLNYVYDTIYFNTIYPLDLFILRVFYGYEPTVLNTVPVLYPHLYPISPETEAVSSNTLTNITELVINNLYACTESILNFLYSL